MPLPLGIGPLLVGTLCAANLAVAVEAAAPDSAKPPRYVIRTVAGTGSAGYAGDGGPAVRAALNNPYGLVRLPDQTLYFCDMGNHRIRKIDSAGTISTVAGSGERGYSGDHGPARAARLNEPYEIRVDPGGNLFFVEMQNHLVRKVEAKTGHISTVAGMGKPGFSGDGGPATNALLNQPHSVQLDAAGNIYICDIGNHRIRVVESKTGTIRTLAGTGKALPTSDGAGLEGTPLKGPRALDFDRAGDLWVALREGNALYKIDLRAGRIEHQAGTGEAGFSGNGGPALEAKLSGPKGLGAGPDGNIYFADTESHSIRRLNVRRQTIELVAGTGTRGDGPDGDPSTCHLARPHGIFVDGEGRIWVGDSENHRVRVITPFRE